jgi:simple sugar transport system ATP-binding protein
MTFGSFTALRNVSVDFEPGKVHAIVGQNGAGKTTFARVVCGLYAPTSGRVLVDDALLPTGDVLAARAHGVDMVHQNFSLPPSFTVAEALHLFRTGTGMRSFRGKQLVRHWQQELDRHGPTVSARARVRDLSVEARQGLEITRALSGGQTRLLILDEPTAVLSPTAVEALFRRLRELAVEGMTVLVVLHKLAEVRAIADTVTVLRAGEVALPTTPLADVDTETITESIIGEDARAGRPPRPDLSADGLPANGERRPTESALELLALSTQQQGRDAGLREVDLRVGPGEVVGIAGVEGNGQQALVNVIAGLIAPSSGRVGMLGRDVTRAGVLTRRRLGLRLIPFDRNTQGVSLTSTLWQNVGVAGLLLARGRLYAPRQVRRTVRAALDRWGVKYRTVNQAAGELSGGNVQRVILAREISEDARIVVAAQPTRGLDLGATAFVHATIRELAARGVAVVLVSSDLDELRDTSDRIVVVRGGRAVADLPATASLTEIGAAMVGGRDA